MSHSVQGQPSNQVWLPNMKVWARMPDRSAKTADNLPVTRQPGDVGGEAAVPQQQYGPARQTAVSLAQTDSDVECLEPDNTGTEEESDLPTCPICLGEILGRWDKAVVNPCMHVFCLACLSRWSALKKSCPLCKSRIQGYMYNIVSDTDYREQILPATPPREKEPSPPIAARSAGTRAIIDEPPAHRHAAQPGRAHSTVYTDRPLVSSRTGDRRGVFRQSSNPQSNEWVHGTWPPRRAPGQWQATTSSSQQRSEPRPYFYRVQAQAQSQAQAAARDRADVARSPQDAAEAWRRHIYVEGLYAQPMEGGPAVTVPPIMPEERKQHRLDAWVDRELRALLQTDDVAIVRAYVMGLVRGIGFVVQQDGAEGSGEQAASSARTDATAALKPFLHEHAAHFWHELRCFAAVSVSMQTYDRLVVYSPRQSADAHISQPSTAHASSSSEQGAGQLQSRPAIVEAQLESSIARQGKSPEGQGNPAATIRGDSKHRRRGGSSQAREPHTSPNGKRRRFSSRQPSAEPGDQSRSCNGHHQLSEPSHEATNGAQCSSERSQHHESTTVAVRCSGSESSRPSTSSSGAGQDRHMYRDKRQHQSNDAFKQRLQHRLPHDEHRKIGPESHVEAQRGSSDSQMLAELRMRALAAVRAHREHL